MSRYSMRGLESYGDDLGAFLDGEKLKEQLMAGGVGAVGILATSAVLSRLPVMAEDPMMNSRIKNLIAIGVGVLGAAAIDGDSGSRYRRDMAMGFVGAVAGSGLAALAASWAPDTLSTSLSGGLSDADLSALEATVATNSAAYRAPAALSASFGSPVVTDSTLRSTETTDEVLAAYNAFMPAAPPPSF